MAEENDLQTGIGDDSGPRSNVFRSVSVLFLCLCAGIVFGFASEKGRVFEPSTIRLQMVFQKWIMMKMFMSAIVSGVLVFCIFSIVPFEFIRNRWESAVADYESTVSHKNIFAVLIGCLVLGIGMTFCGACPGMVLPQFGAWTHNSIFTLLGALLGALSYGLIHDSVYSSIFPNDQFVLPTMLSKVFKTKYWVFGLPLLIVLLGAVICLEVFIPWKNDVSWDTYSTPYINDAPTIFQQIAWPPSICGLLIGLMQAVIILVVGDTLGGSSSYVTLVSQPFRTRGLRDRFPYLVNKQNGLGNWWQVFYVCGGIIGGIISSQLSRTSGQVPGVPVYFGLIGGFLLVFGARMASGCTSGHGLSGAGLLMLSSFVGVPAMFAGAIATGYIMQAAGELNHLCLSINC